MKRVALCFIGLALSAQTHSTDRDIVRAHAAWDKFAIAANDWSQQHSDFTVSRADKERFKIVESDWNEFHSLYKLVK